MIDRTTLESDSNRVFGHVSMSAEQNGGSGGESTQISGVSLFTLELRLEEPSLVEFVFRVEIDPDISDSLGFNGTVFASGTESGFIGQARLTEAEGTSFLETRVLHQLEAESVFLSFTSGLYFMPGQRFADTENLDVSFEARIVPVPAGMAALALIALVTARRRQ